MNRVNITVRKQMNHWCLPLGNQLQTSDPVVGSEKIYGCYRECTKHQTGKCEKLITLHLPGSKFLNDCLATEGATRPCTWVKSIHSKPPNSKPTYSRQVTTPWLVHEHRINTYKNSYELDKRFHNINFTNTAVVDCSRTSFQPIQKCMTLLRGCRTAASRALTKRSCLSPS